MTRLRPITVLALAIPLTVGACGGGTSATSPSKKSGPSVAEKLATIQKGEPVQADDPLVRKFRRSLDALSRKCKDRRIRLADMTVTAQQLLHKEGIEESLSSVIAHVNESIPKGLGKQPCADIFAAYVTLREKG